MIGAMKSHALFNDGYGPASAMLFTVSSIECVVTIRSADPTRGSDPHTRFEAYKPALAAIFKMYSRICRPLMSRNTTSQSTEITIAIGLAIGNVSWRTVQNCVC